MPFSYDVSFRFKEGSNIDEGKIAFSQKASIVFVLKSCFGFLDYNEYISVGFQLPLCSPDTSLYLSIISVQRRWIWWKKLYWVH